MKFAHFFITRPIFAIVVSIVLVILGGLAYTQLPVASYPEIAPPTVVVTAVYPGANPQTLADTVATPIEEQVNGVEDMLYMSSQSASDGTMTLTVTFKLGTNLDVAQVLVQNRVAIAEPELPEEVRNVGVTVQKQSPNIMLVINLLSAHHQYDTLYMANYAVLQIQEVLKRVEGVGNVQIFGTSQYSMRLWMDPDKMFSRGLTPGDVISAVQAQNVQVAAGTLGEEPAPPGTNFQLIVNTKGRLTDPKEFDRIIVKRGADGQLVRFGDVGHAELGAQTYVNDSFLSGQPSVGIAIFQLPGANALKTAQSVENEMARLAKSFPPGLHYDIAYNPTTFISQSIRAVIETLFEAILLVVIVVLIFLQSWRTAIIPLCAVPVSLIGTFAVMKVFGFSLNNLSLFGLVLAIGIVVDDAIVVVENVERWLEAGHPPVEATTKAMDEVSGAIVAIAIVLTSVFVPTALISGITGQFYRQFALTIAVATIISAFNSLTLSPALAALLLRPRDAKKDLVTRGVDFVLGWLFRLFNRTFDATNRGYAWIVQRLVRFSAVAVLVYAGLLALTALGFKIIPAGFIPTQDQGYLIAIAQLPDAASLQRTDEVRKKFSDAARKIPGVAYTVEIAGLSALDFTNRPNYLTMFLPLKSFEERAGHPEQTMAAILQKVQQAAAKIQEAFIIALPPPPVQGIGNAGGFKLEVEDRHAAGVEALAAQTDNLIAAGMKEGGLTGFFTSFRTQVPQIYLNIDREKAEDLDVPIDSVFQTLQAYLGSYYANDFNFLGRTYQVNLQADARFRVRPEQIRSLYTRNATGGMVPLGTLLDVAEINAPDKVMHYNLYPAADLNGSTLPGVSSGQAIEKMADAAGKTLSDQFGYEWTELSLQEKMAGNTALFIFPLCVLFVFLALSAQYESWSLPLIIILIVPMCLLSALTGVYIRGFDNNIFTQIAFVVLVGLACKNAILIVEFARQQTEAGKGHVEAAVEAARLRLRPILMTSFAFILGVVPLVIATGAGAEMRQVLGTAVFSGMIGVTFFGIFLTPVFFVVITGIFGTKESLPAKEALPPAHEPPVVAR
jgi:multidrug efflux pump